MPFEEPQFSSVLAETASPTFVAERKAVGDFVRQLSQPDFDFLTLFVATDLRLLDALAVRRCGSRFPAEEIVRRGVTTGAAGIILATSESGGEGSTDIARLAAVALQNACRETDVVMLDCLLLSKEGVHSLTGLNRTSSSRPRFLDNPWSLRSG